MKSIISLIIICCLLISPVYAKSNLAKKASKLQMLTHKIILLKNNLFTIKHKRNRMQNNLKNTELKIGRLAKKISYNQTQVVKKHQQLKKIKQQRQKYQQQLAIQKKLLAKQIYSSYILGRQPYIKIILNQEDPTKISRYLYYYAQFNQARLSCKNHRIDFLREKKNRQHFLTKTTRELQNKNQQLNKLVNDKKHLENIISGLRWEYSYSNIPGKSFMQMRGKLHCPIVGGKLTQAYGQSLVGGKMHSTGILLQAKTGTKIHAIFPGKVLFADWLHGFGLLVIVQHGKSYMTLYGHNQSLYVKRGDTVNAGQVIATVGNSGGLQTSSLYFEIRHNAQPVNPAVWLCRA